MKYDAVALVSLISLLALTFSRPATAADVVLEWDPPNDSRVAGHIVYWGSESGRYAQSSRDRGDVLLRADTRYTVVGLSDAAPVYFAVVSVDAAGRASEFSNEAARPRISSPPAGFAARFGPCGCVRVSGSAAAESVVRLFANNLLVGETVADGSGNWSAPMDLAPAGAGAVELVARATGADSLAVSGRALPRENRTAGDLDGDGGVGLGDVVVALQLLAGGLACGLAPDCEVTGDGRIGLPDAIFLLREVAMMG